MHKLNSLRFKVALLSLFIGYLCTVANCASLDDGSILNEDPPKLSTHPKLVVLSYDGFRFDYMDKTDTPTLDRLKSQGVHSPYMLPQFSTKTFPNHQSLATGLHTESHGIIDNSVYDPDFGQLSGFLRYNKEFWNFRQDVAPVWIHNQWAGGGRFSGASWPGANHPYGLNDTFPTHYLTYNKSLSFEDRIEHVVKWLTDDEKPANLVFMYFNEPDGKGHAFGPESPEVIHEIQIMDNVTEYLLTRLEEKGIQDEINIIVLSDHGFQEVSLKNMIRLSELVDLNSIHDPNFGTPVAQFRPKDGKLEEVYQSLKEGSERLNFSVYKKEDLPKEWRFGDNRRIMPIVAVADLGFVFDDFVNRTRFFNERYNLTSDEDRKYGMHGYDNKAKSMRAFFLAYGPAFKKGYKIPPFENVDLFPLICKIMDFAPAPNNGTLNIIGEALASSSGSSVSLVKSSYSVVSLFLIVISVFFFQVPTLHIGN